MISKYSQAFKTCRHHHHHHHNYFSSQEPLRHPDGILCGATGNVLNLTSTNVPISQLFLVISDYTHSSEKI